MWPLRRNLLQNTAAYAPSGGGAPTMPTGALGIWYGDEYTTTPRTAIPNNLSAQPVNASLLNFPRAPFAFEASVALISATTTEGQTAADGEAAATALVGTGGSWQAKFQVYLAAGTYTLACDHKRNTGTDQTFALLQGAGTSATFTATSAWGTNFYTFTLGSSGTLNIGFYSGGGSCNILIDNLRLFSGSSDLGAATLGGHLYLGTSGNPTSDVPAFANNYIDLAGSGKGGLSFIPSVATYTNFTFTATIQKSTGGSSGNMALLGNTASPYDPDFFIDAPGYRQGGARTTAYDTNANSPLGLFGYSSQFEVFTLRADGTNLDMFINGMLVGRNALTPSARSFARMVLGDYAGFTTGYKIYSLGFWASALTDSQVSDAYLATKSRALALTTPINMPTARRMLYAEGDSITAGSFITTGYIQLFGANSSPITYGTDRAVAGSTFTTMNARGTAADAFIPSTKEAGFKAIYYAMIGTNDNGGGATPATYAAALGQHFADRKAAGFTHCVAATLLGKGGDATFNTNRAALNTILQGGAWQSAWGIDGLVDFAADATIGTDAAAANTTYFSDGVHPTQAGANIMEPIFRAVINGL